MAMKMSLFCAGDKHFSAGNECVESVRLNFSHTHTQLARLPSSHYVEKIATHRYLRLKTSGFTFLYSPSSTLHPQIVHTIAFSAGQNSPAEKMINKLLHVHVLTFSSQ